MPTIELLAENKSLKDRIAKLEAESARLRGVIGLVVENIDEDLDYSGWCNYCMQKPGYNMRHSKGCPWKLTMDACKAALGVEG